MDLHPAEQLALEAARVRDHSLRAQPERQRRHGIVHTAPELARFAVGAVDALLQEHCQLALGLADPRVHVVDPACGPGAFLAAALRLCQLRASAPATISGIDIDPGSLQLAAALSPVARELGTVLQLHNTDTLRDSTLLSALAQPQQVLALIGNPPWTVSAQVASPTMQQQLEDFRCDEQGVRLPERKLGVLSDAYVRFFRWAAELARASSRGAVLGLVTNGSFLDGPVHRGMRAALQRWFDEIVVVDLGGNALLSAAQHAGPPDENVFGVRPSVAITLLCRLPEVSSTRVTRSARVRYARVFGSRQEKLAALAQAQLSELALTPLSGPSGSQRFVPTRARDEQYSRWPSLAECMPFHREGVQSNRDAVVVDADKLRLIARLRAFVAGEELPVLNQANTALPHYHPEQARAAVARALARDPDGNENLSVRRLAYRPFDERWFCPVTPLCHRPRPELLRACDRSSLVLISVRKDRGRASYTHFGAAVSVIDNCFLSTRSSCRSRAFPTHTPDGHENLAIDVQRHVAELLGAPCRPEAFAGYVLAVLASPSYRARFDAELRMDYPRIPWPRTLDIWHALTRAGSALALLLTAAPSPQQSAEPEEDAHARAALRIGHHEFYGENSTTIERALRDLDPYVLQALAAG